MEICMQTPLLSLLLNLVLSVGNVMLPIEDLMVDGGCIATTGGRRLFTYIDNHITYRYDIRFNITCQSTITLVNRYQHYIGSHTSTFYQHCALFIHTLLMTLLALVLKRTTLQLPKHKAC
jgi:hypothetical protein